jgi:excisionase family DNA binding protein
MIFRPKSDQRSLVLYNVDKEIFDLQSAADHLGHSRRWLRENAVSLGIEHERVGRKFRFTRTELENFLARHRRRGKRGVYMP